MPKTVMFTTITPLPAGITRTSVLDMYHDHLAMIDLNPLVVERFNCKPPVYAPTNEYWSTWYTIKDKVSYLPAGLATGSVSYHACFQNTSEGLQTHVYAPLGLDIQGKWSVGGQLPGEPKPLPEPGLKTPRRGLYIREDVKMTCSSLLLGFVKRTFKDSHGHLVDKLVERAHILESNFANERLQALRNVDPAERMGHGDIFIAPPPDYLSQTLQVPSPHFASHARIHSDPVLSPGFSSASTLVDRNAHLPSPSKSISRPMSLMFMHEEKSMSASAPEPASFLLPATTYDGDLSKRHVRSISLYPSNPLAQHSERVISLRSQSPHPPQEEQMISPQPPRISYTPEERPISFTFPTFDPKNPFDRTSNYSSQSDQQNLLNDIDDAIDEAFMYTLPATTYTTLPATTYKSEPILSSAMYKPKHERMDSVTPNPVYSDKDLPPVPLKDEKYKKASLQG
ncbi:hypothetical protein EJ02DRAFT_419936 [Clathrospora elynae]|uniref:DUF7053 domain-containing protein n=1 Tax=Clathrospora elynae TaxID=706981 RepID=A0A6A5SYD0_9PLEO|nr:hypothetical protein EJ02DRAFT_419936 [Clathrospora elynae]